MSSILDDIALEAGADIFSLIYSLYMKELTLSAPTSRRLKNLLEKWLDGACQLVGDNELFDSTLKLLNFLKTSSKNREQSQLETLTHEMVLAMTRAGRRRKIFTSLCRKAPAFMRGDKRQATAQQ